MEEHNATVDLPPMMMTDETDHNLLVTKSSSTPIPNDDTHSNKLNTLYGKLRRQYSSIAPRNYRLIHEYYTAKNQLMAGTENKKISAMQWFAYYKTLTNVGTNYFTRKKTQNEKMNEHLNDIILFSCFKTAYDDKRNNALKIIKITADGYLFEDSSSYSILQNRDYAGFYDLTID